MNDDRRELLSRLFEAATELVETAHEAAVAGQSGALAAPGLKYRAALGAAYGAGLCAASRLSQGHRHRQRPRDRRSRAVAHSQGRISGTLDMGEQDLAGSSRDLFWAV